MCATCGCLMSSASAPEDGTYECVESKKAGKSEKVAVKKGETMPKCKSCGDRVTHWVKA